MIKKFSFLIVVLQLVIPNNFVLSDIIPLKKPSQTKEETKKKLLTDVLKPLPKPIKITETENKEKKGKIGTKKRELKLTVSRALSDEIETRERSLASVKRARQKELKNANKEENSENLKGKKSSEVELPN